ncbi:MAG: bacillithiol biosynthesis BshC [Planctomycetota bacterium]|nr:bacillithiol biosynthesis BshC [Planctomycetota bacterium]
MERLTIPYARLDPGNDVARAYLCEPERALALFARDYRDPAALESMLSSRAAPDLTDGLVEYNRAVGGSVEGAQRLRDGFCVVSGQQVGLLYGPAYTTYKLFTVQNLARALESALNVPVVPVFWVESEDHDWDEVNRFFWKGQRYRVDGDVVPGTPIADIEIDPGPLLESLRGVLDPAAEAWGLVEPETSVARWHVRNLARLAPDVVYLEPRLLREPMRPLAERIAAAADDIDGALARETGFERRLAPVAGSYLFDASGPRRRLERGAAVPDAWSTDVVSRVLVQNAALPVLAAVCGPAEISYWSQLRALHERFDIAMPAVVPRDAATLVEAGMVKDAAKLGLDIEEVVRGVAAPPAAGASDPVASRLRDLAAEAAGLFTALEGGSLDLPPNTEKPFRRTVQRLGDDLEKLAGRLDDARAEAAGAGKRRYERVLGELRPRDGLQERTHSLFPYLVRHGPGLAASLRDSFDPYEFGHYLVFL